MVANNTAFVIAQSLLQAVVDLYAAEGLDLPARQYINDGAEVAWDCLAGDAMIWTTNGAVPLQEIQEGDRVWSWDEDRRLTTRKVIARIPKGQREVLEIKTPHRTLHVTPEHQMLVTRWGYRIGRGEGNGKGTTSRWWFEWVRADQLKRGDVLVSAGALPDTSFTPSLPDGTIVDEDVAWFIGAFIGDGNVMRQGFALCLYGEKRERALDILERIWGYEGKAHPHHGLYVYAPELARLFEQMGLRRRSPHREIPSWVWTAARKLQLAFADGYANADGYIAPLRGREKRLQRIAFACTSKNLMEQLRALYMMMGISTTNLGIEKRKKEITIKGKRVKNALPLHRFTARPYRDPEYTHLSPKGVSFFKDTDFLPERIRSIQNAGAMDVYDLAIEGTHNFIADGLVVHNCESVVVSLGRVYRGTSNRPTDLITSQRCVGVRTAEYHIWIVRCASTPDDSGNPPSTTLIESFAEPLYTDMWVLPWGLTIAALDGSLGFSCDDILISTITMQRQQGAYAGVELLVEYQLGN